MNDATNPLNSTICLPTVEPDVFPNMKSLCENCDHSLIPDFVPSAFAAAVQNHNNDNVHKTLLNKDWITVTLKEQIESLFPSASDINMTNGNRDPITFQAACEKMFPVGRVFASSKQLHQASKIFLDAWGVKCVNNGKKITCFYGRRNRDINRTVNPQRVHSKNLKGTDCNFHINFSYLNNDGNRKWSTFIPVNVSSTDLTHNHEVSSVTHRQALKSSGRLSLNLVELKMLLILLREKPNLDASSLRPLLLNHFPHYVSIDSKLMNNFRLKAMNYWSSHRESDELTMEEATKLSDLKNPLASDDIVNVDDPLTKVNVKHILRKICSESNDMWMAVSFLKKMKESTPGFEYRVKYDDKGIPEGIMYMSPRMRQDLIRYSDILFLDAQARQYNSSGFPYISPCVTDNENKVAQVAEAIVIEEEISVYAWVINMMHEIEPRFDKSSIRIIFGDGKIVQSLLETLDIQPTCILRGDKWHLLNKVWPEKFGPIHYPIIKNALITMMDCNSIESWDIAAENARKLISSYPHLVMYIDEIHQNPSYYAGYFLKFLVGGALGKNGSSGAEQNHSSVVAYNGKGANWCIADQLHHLILRCQNRSKSKDEFEQNLQFAVTRFVSSFMNREAEWDRNARLSLSNHAYNTLWLPALRKASYLQQEVSDNGDVTIWPIDVSFDQANISKVVLSPNKRCTCFRAREYLSQCEHEILVANGFDQRRFHHRWLNQWTYRRIVQELDFNENLSYTRMQNNSIGRYNKNTTIEHLSNGDDNENDLSQEDNPEDNPEDFSQEDDPEESSIDDNEDDQSTFSENNSSQTNLSQSNDTGGTTHINLHPWNEGQTFVQESNNTSLEQVPQETREKLSYNQIVSQFQTLASIIQNDQNEMCRVSNAINDMIYKYRRQDTISISVTTITRNNEDTSLRGTTVASTSAWKQGRKKSSREYAQTKRRKLNPSSSSASVVASLQGQRSDDVHIPRIKNTTKPCKLCKGPGHRGYMRCIKIIHFCEPYNTTPLPKNCYNSRHFLVQKIIKDNAVLTQPLYDSDNREVYKSLPNKMTALIIHKRFKRVSVLTNKGAGESSVILEITFLTNGGNADLRYNQVLFEASPICTWIVRSKTNIIVSQLEDVLSKENTPEKKNRSNDAKENMSNNVENINPTSSELFNMSPPAKVHRPSLHNDHVNHDVGDQDIN
jgi:hypothetical protein